TLPHTLQDQDDLADVESSDTEHPPTTPTPGTILREQMQHQISENEARLESACLVVLTSIVENRELMPGAIRRMCHFLRVTVEEIYKELGGFVPSTATAPALMTYTSMGSDSASR